MSGWQSGRQRQRCWQAVATVVGLWLWFWWFWSCTVYGVRAHCVRAGRLGGWGSALEPNFALVSRVAWWCWLYTIVLASSSHFPLAKQVEDKWACSRARRWPPYLDGARGRSIRRNGELIGRWHALPILLVVQGCGAGLHMRQSRTNSSAGRGVYFAGGPIRVHLVWATVWESRRYSGGKATSIATNTVGLLRDGFHTNKDRRVEHAPRKFEPGDWRGTCALGGFTLGRPRCRRFGGEVD